MFTSDKVEDLAAQMLINSYQEEKPQQITEDERMKAKIEELMAFKQKMEEATEITGFADKQEVIAELEKREIKFDRRKTKAELEKLLQS